MLRYFFLIAQLFTVTAAWAEEELPKQLVGVEVQEKLGKKIDLKRSFLTHKGVRTTLGEILSDHKPMMLTLNYSRCQNLCSIQLNGLTESLNKVGWTPGKDYQLVTVSIDPKETPQLAAKRQEAMLKRIVVPHADWTFLVGAEQDVRALADEVGFQYKYLPEEDQFAHPAVVYLISPDGMISRYIYGLEYKPLDIRFGLMEAGTGKIGSIVDRILLSCYHYDATIGRYGPTAFKVMRLGAVLIVLVLSLMLWRFWRREKLSLASL